MEKITSVKNPAVRALRDLKDRRTRVDTGRILVEGEVMIREALKCGLTPCDLLAEECFADFAAEMAGHGARCFEVPRSLLEAVCETKSPQGVCASFTAPQPRSVGALGGAVVALDGVQDPGNVGTIWRTADALGADGLLLVNGCADPWNPKTVRATMGACFRLPVYETAVNALLPMLESAGLPLYATALREDTEDVRSAALAGAAVIIGSEGRGVSPRALERCQKTLKIPMRERCESLNAAVAAAVVLWEMAR